MIDLQLWEVHAINVTSVHCDLCEFWCQARNISFGLSEGGLAYHVH